MTRLHRFMILSLACLFVLVGASLTQAAGTQSPINQEATEAASATPAGTGDIRNARYCEVLPIALKGGKLVASVYNTLGLNECPDEAWKALDVKAIQQQFKAIRVELNGPRYFLMNQIIPKGATASGETVMIGGIGFTKRAEVVLSLTGMKSIPYETRDIERDTSYVFKKGDMIFELVDADGNHYVMQSYSLIIDPKLTIDDLPNLGDRLKLPDGWTFQTAVPEQDLVLTADGVAHVIQDDFGNTYQRIEKADLTATAATPAEATATVTP